MELFGPRRWLVSIEQSFSRRSDDPICWIFRRFPARLELFRIWHIASILCFGPAPSKSSFQIQFLVQHAILGHHAIFYEFAAAETKQTIALSYRARLIVTNVDIETITVVGNVLIDKYVMRPECRGPVAIFSLQHGDSSGTRTRGVRIDRV